MQVQLFDKPAEAMAQQMADAIWSRTLPLLVGALALGAATLAATLSHSGPPEATPILALGALGFLAGGLLPVLKPLLEVQQLSQLTGDQIEAAVDVKQPLQVRYKPFLPATGPVPHPDPRFHGNRSALRRKCLPM